VSYTEVHQSSLSNRTLTFALQLSTQDDVIRAAELEYKEALIVYASDAAIVPQQNDDVPEPLRVRNTTCVKGISLICVNRNSSDTTMKPSPRNYNSQALSVMET